jgi:hypothetical protein
MALRQLRRACAALVDQLDIPEPFDAAELCRRLAAQRSRPIHLLPIALSSDGPCGLWLASRTADYVFYEQRTSRLHQEHIILHEVGHLVCQHEHSALIDEDAAAMLLPSLAPAMVERALKRTGYSGREEQQAEMIASLILERVSRETSEPCQAVAPDMAGIAGRLELALELPPRRRPTRSAVIAAGQDPPQLPHFGNDADG